MAGSGEWAAAHLDNGSDYSGASMRAWTTVQCAPRPRSQAAGAITPGSDPLDGARHPRPTGSGRKAVTGGTWTFD